MNLKILWMYSDLMDLYGDKGNIQVLKTRCTKRNIDCVVDTCTIDEKRDPAEYDLIFMGGGADFEQNLIYRDLINRKSRMKAAMANGSAFLLICGGYQLFGQYYRDGDGNIVDGLGFFDYYTESTDRDHRCIGNIAVKAAIDSQEFQAVGFENHGGQTKNVQTPFAKVLKGHGNTFDGGLEGFVTDQVLATYMHGSLLPKNPKVADIVIRRALRKRYGHVELAVLDDSLEKSARDTMLRRLGVEPE